MDEVPESTLADQERERFYELAEVLIPPGGSGPSADEAGVPTQFIDELLILRPDLVAPLSEILRLGASEDPRQFCAFLENEQPKQFERLTFAVAGAYFLNPRVRDWLKYEGQTGEFQDGTLLPEYAPGGMLDAVRKRGPIYRPA